MEIVEIKVERLFLAEFQKCVAYALSEFGRKTVKNWNAEYEKIRHRLEIMPTGYPFVPELQKWQKYRGAIIMKNFKVIYFYNEEKDIIWLVDLWDLRQDPCKLNLRARKIEGKEYHKNYKHERNMEEKKYHSSLFCRILEKVFR